MALSWKRWFGLETTVPLPTREGYAVWADTYPPRPHNRLMAAEQEIVEPIIRLARPKRALDVGTGTGRYLSLLRAAGANFIVGVDLSLPMLQHRQCQTPRVCGDACQLPFADGQFDLVCSSLMAGEDCTFQISSTRVDDVFTCCPPGPPERVARKSSSLRGMESSGLIITTSSIMETCMAATASSTLAP